VRPNAQRVQSTGGDLPVSLADCPNAQPDCTAAQRALL
jgi:hypothetical protein